MSLFSPFGFMQQNGTGIIIPISLSGLTIYTDAKFNASYSGTGSTWYSLVTPQYNAILYNNPTFNSSSPQYFSFDGVNDYAEFDAAGKGSDFTDKSFGGWVKTTISSTDKVFYIRGSDIDIPHHGWNMSLYKNTENKFVFSVVQNGVQVDCIGTSTMSNNTWYYIFATFDISEQLINLYINGSLENTTHTGRNDVRPSTIGWQVGTYNGNYSQVDISDFEFYESTVLDSTTITNNFNAQQSIYGITPSTPTPTPTVTPTNTPTSTPPVSFCTDTIVISNADPSLSNYNGTYTNITTYTGGTFTGGYLYRTTGVFGYFVTGNMTETGLLYKVYERYDSGFYYTLLMRNTSEIGPIPFSWGIVKCLTTSIVNGGTVSSSGGTYRVNNSNINGTNTGTIYIPLSGTTVTGATYPLDVYYYDVCPSPTPTPTPTNTPTVTPTKTVTPTPTPTPTPVYELYTADRYTCDSPSGPCTYVETLQIANPTVLNTSKFYLDSINGYVFNIVGGPISGPYLYTNMGGLGTNNCSSLCSI